MPAKGVVAGINDQIAKEFYAAYLYLAMAAYCDAESLPGFAHWMRMQYDEELGHALRLFDFLLERGERVQLKAIEKPPLKFGSPLEVIKATLAHEKKVTASINKLYETAVKEKDYPAQLMLQWFINEQVEEERSVGDIIAQLEMAGDSGPALLMMDRQLASRQAEGGGE
ncbi:MAG: ferritin [Gemmatimonadales bacterium]